MRLDMLHIHQLMSDLLLFRMSPRSMGTDPVLLSQLGRNILQNKLGVSENNRQCHTLMHSERPQLYTSLAFLSAKGLRKLTIFIWL